MYAEKLSSAGVPVLLRCCPAVCHGFTEFEGPEQENGIRWLQDLNAIVIDPARTPNIAREFTQYEYRRDRDGNFLPDVPDRDNHTIDSCRYALEREIMTRRARTRGDLY